MPLERELIKDACGDRVINEVPRRPQIPLSLDRVYPQVKSKYVKGIMVRSSVPDAELIKNYQYAGGSLAKDAFLAVVTQATSILCKEPNLVRVDGKVLVVGDIHGQFYDLVEMLRKQKFGKTRTKVLFMGDYVDRGKFQPECVAYLFALKAQFPTQVYLLRGNHETREMTESYDFRQQMITNYDLECYQAVMDMFD